MSLAAAVIAELINRHQTVATAESITAGLIAATLTDVPGASAAVRGGLIVYATDLKVHLAGLPAELIARHGVVSAAVAETLALAAQQRCQADWGIGVTGVAGPGPSDGLPPGRVWLAIAGPAGQQAERWDIAGDRATVRQTTVTAALTALSTRLSARPTATNKLTYRD